MFARRWWSQPSATVRNRSQPSATVRARTIWPCLWEVLQEGSFLAVSDVSLLRFAWQAWHFVTCRRVLERVESRFAWQAQYFCVVVRRCVAVFVAGATLDASIVIFRGRRSTLDVSCCVCFANRIGRAASSGDRCKFRGRSDILCEVLKIDGSLARNIDFEVANFQVLRKTRRKKSILKLQRVKIGGSLARNAPFGGSSPCQWGKLQNLSFSHVANCENCRKSRRKCLFFCTHVSCLESLVFLWCRRVYGGSWKTSPIRMCPSRLSCRFAWEAWRFVTFQAV